MVTEPRRPAPLPRATLMAGAALRVRLFTVLRRVARLAAAAAVIVGLVLPIALAVTVCCRTAVADRQLLSAALAGLRTLEAEHNAAARAAGRAGVQPLIVDGDATLREQLAAVVLQLRAMARRENRPKGSR
jgi:hypothetical protein